MVRWVAVMALAVGCGRSFVSPASPTLSISVDSSQLAPLGHTQVHAVGGDGQNVYGIVDAGTGSTVSSTGLYTAGPGDPARGEEDAVEVTDVSGSVARAKITIGPAVQLSPGEATVSPNGTLAFLAQGGVAPYSFALARHGNGSFGTVTSSGQYQAGVNADQVDEVQVIDGNGAVAVASVAVGDPVLQLQSFGDPTVYLADVNGDGQKDVLVLSGNVLQLALSTTGASVLNQVLVLPCSPSGSSTDPGATLRVLDENGDGFDDVVGDCGVSEIFLLRGSFDGQLIPAAGWPWSTPDAGALANLALDAYFAPIDARPALAAEPLAIIPNAPFNFFAGVDLYFVGESDVPRAAPTLGPTPFQVLGDIPLTLGGQASQLVTAQTLSAGNSLVVVDQILGTATADAVVSAVGIGPLLDGGVGPRAVAMAAPLDCPAHLHDELRYADLDGDGLADIYVVVLDGGTACLNRGSADATFQSGVTLSLPEGAALQCELPSDDLHTSTRLLFSSATGGQVASWTAGGWSIASEGMPPGTVAAAAGDVDGDGRADLVTVDRFNELVFSLADNGGHYESGRTFHTTPNGLTDNHVFPVVSALPALAVHTGTGLWVVEPSRTGGLSQSVLNLRGESVSTVAADGTGFWAQAEGGDGVRVSFQDGGWSTEALSLPLGWTLQAALQQTGRIDGGVAVALDGSSSAQEVSIAPDGSVASTPIAGVSGAPLVTVPVAGGVADDLMVQPGGSGPIQVFAAATDGSLTWPSIPTDTFDASRLGAGLSALHLLQGPVAMAVGALPDHVLLWAVSTADSVQHLYAYGPATQDVVEMGDGFIVERIALGDFDGDGLVDVLVWEEFVTRGPITAHIYRQQAGGAGFVDEAVDLPVLLPKSTSESYEIAAIDLDGDGRSEALTLDRAAGTVTVHHNTTVPGGPITFN